MTCPSRDAAMRFAYRRAVAASLSEDIRASRPNARIIRSAASAAAGGADPGTPDASPRAADASGSAGVAGRDPESSKRAARTTTPLVPSTGASAFPLDTPGHIFASSVAASSDASLPPSLPDPRSVEPPPAPSRDAPPPTRSPSPSPSPIESRVVVVTEPTSTSSTMFGEGYRPSGDGRETPLARRRSATADPPPPPRPTPGPIPAPTSSASMAANSARYCAPSGCVDWKHPTSASPRTGAGSWGPICAPSRNTRTPRGAAPRAMASAMSAASLSGVCARRANTSATRATLLRPTMTPSRGT